MGDPYIADLIAVDNAIFVVDLISKTRDAGLIWQQLSPNLYTSKLEEQCLPLSKPASTWIFYVGKNQANDATLSYVYYIEVLLNSVLDIFTDSRQTNYVEQLFQTIELSQVPQNNWNIDRAIEFISKISTNPSSSTFTIAMCGGIIIGGEAIYSISVNEITAIGGVIVGGVAIVTQNFEIIASESFIHAIAKVLHTTQSVIEVRASIQAIGEIFCLAQVIMASELFVQADGYTIRSLLSDSFIQANGNAIYSGGASIETSSHIQAHASVILLLTGPSVGPLNTWSTPFVVTPASLFTGIVAFDDGGNGGTFDPPILTFTNSVIPQSFTYTTAISQLTPIIVPISISSTPPSNYVNSPINYSAEIAIFLYVPARGTIGIPANLVVLPCVSYTGLVGFTDNDNSGTFTPIALTFTNGFPQNATYTPAGPGPIPLQIGSIPSVPLYLDGDTHTNLPKTISVV